MRTKMKKKQKKENPIPHKTKKKQMIILSINEKCVKVSNINNICMMYVFIHEEKKGGRRRRKCTIYYIYV